MKKFSLAMILAAVVGCLSFSSCSLLGLNGPQDTWCKAEISYNEAKLNCWIMFSEDEYVATKSNRLDKEIGTIPAGLTLVLSPAKGSSTNDFIPANNYVIKTFPLGTKTVEDDDPDDGEDKPFSFLGAIGKESWTAMYIAGYLSKGGNWIEDSDTIVPNPISTDTNFEEFSASNISWKKVLLAMLINYLDD